MSEPNEPPLDLESWTIIGKLNDDITMRFFSMVPNREFLYFFTINKEIFLIL